LTFDYTSPIRASSAPSTLHPPPSSQLPAPSIPAPILASSVLTAARHPRTAAAILHSEKMPDSTWALPSRPPGPRPPPPLTLRVRLFRRLHPDFRRTIRSSLAWFLRTTLFPATTWPGCRPVQAASSPIQVKPPSGTWLRGYTLIAGISRDYDLPKLGRPRHMVLTGRPKYRQGNTGAN
jgi:hypothetical protein